MTTPDLDVIKDIPGYKVILKAVLKSQIQQLVELLAVRTDEESVFLTASVSDGTLSHLGSDSGKGFLEGHEDIKSQFLGFCLKNHHRKAQEKKDRDEEEAVREAASIQSRFSSRPPFMVNRPIRPSIHAFSSPRQQFRTPGMRHEPYPTSRPFKLRGPRNFSPRTATPSSVGSPVRTVASPQASASPTVSLSNKVIKIEPDSADECSNQSADDTSVASTPSGGDTTSINSNLPSSSQNSAAATELKDAKPDLESKSSDCDETDNETLPPSDENLDLNFSDTAPAEGLSLDSDLSNLITSAAKDGLKSSDSNGVSQGNSNKADEKVNQTSSDLNASIKVEAVSEAEMELEITGVELGRYSSGAPDGSWSSEEQGTSGYMSGAAGNQGDVPEQGYVTQIKSDAMEVSCDESDVSLTTSVGTEEEEKFVGPSSIDQERPVTLSATCAPERYRDDNGKEVYQCQSCSYRTRFRQNLYKHKRAVHEKKKFTCDVCAKQYASLYYLNEHVRTKHEDVWFLCEVCSKSFRTRRMLNMHKSRIHDKKVKFTCVYCKKELFDENALQGHINKHIGNKPYSCVQCAKSFFYKSSLRRHAKSCKGDNDTSDPNRYKCTECDNVFKSSNTLNDHMMGKHGPKDKICRCGKSFAWRTSLSRHIKKCKFGNLTVHLD